MSKEFAIVDLFAGPGGLAEGFSSIRSKEDGSRPFQIALSVEKETAAFETLRLRSFFRQFKGAPPAKYYHFINGDIPEPNWESLFPIEWNRACLGRNILTFCDRILRPRGCILESQNQPISKVSLRAGCKPAFRPEG